MITIITITEIVIIIYYYYVLASTLPHSGSWCTNFSKSRTELHKVFLSSYNPICVKHAASTSCSAALA